MSWSPTRVEKIMLNHYQILEIPEDSVLRCNGPVTINGIVKNFGTFDMWGPLNVSDYNSLLEIHNSFRLSQPNLLQNDGTISIKCTSNFSTMSSFTSDELSDYGIQLEDCPPTIIVPSLIQLDAETPNGIIVDYIVTVSDVNESLTATCSTPSGSLFPVGRTTVVCSVTDSGGNSVQDEFLVIIENIIYLTPTLY